VKNFITIKVIETQAYTHDCTHITKRAVTREGEYVTELEPLVNNLEVGRCYHISYDERSNSIKFILTGNIYKLYSVDKTCKSVEQYFKETEQGLRAWWGLGWPKYGYSWNPELRLQGMTGCLGVTGPQGLQGNKKLPGIVGVTGIRCEV